MNSRKFVIPAKAGMTTNSVIPAKAGIQGFRTLWIPASAGMTTDSAGMTTPGE
jgi:hypothetical protein